jgi:hypothetical protein
MTQKVSHRDIVRMLENAEKENGLSLQRFFELGRADALDNPTLRDLWLIWGDELTEADLSEAVSAT